jgi:hypothetical protein
MNNFMDRLDAQWYLGMSLEVMPGKGARRRT